MDWNQHLQHLGLPGLAAGLAAVAAGWSRIKSFAAYLSGFFVLQKHLDSALTVSVVRHLRMHYKRPGAGGISNFRSHFAQVDDEVMCSNVPFDIARGSSLWWGKRGFFFIHPDHSRMTVVSIRWLGDPYGLVEDSITERRTAVKDETRFDNNFYVMRLMGTAGENMSMSGRIASAPPQQPASGDQSSMASDSAGVWDEPLIGVDDSWMFPKSRYIQNRKERDPLLGLFFPPDVHEAIASAKQWFTRRQWYQQHGIPWRTGFLFYGPGGTGKSSLARALAEMLGIPLYQFFLNTLTDREFVDHWESMTTPCVVALEDFDTVFHGRESVTVHQSLSFECVLNQISGISSINGVLLTVTTNHLEHIDPAMGRLDEQGRPTRPGRIDHILELGMTTEKQRQEIATYVLDGWASEDISAIVADNADTTAAQFQNRCIHLALDKLARR